MAASAILCDICSTRQSSRPAAIWCQDCNEGMCNFCSEQHSLFKLTRGHKTIPIDDYRQLPSDMLQMTDIRSEHDEKYIMYCRNHLQPCCRNCVLEDHKLCENLAKLEDVTSFKSSLALQDMENSLKEYLETIKEMKADRKTNLESIETESKKASGEMVIFRHKINQHLDFLQNKFQTELNHTKEKTKKTILGILNTLDSEEIIIKENIQTLSKIKEYATDLQAFLYSFNFENHVHNAKNHIELNKDESCSEFIMVYLFDKFIIEFAKQFTSFGSVEIDCLSSFYNHNRKRETKAQLAIPKPSTKQKEHIDFMIERTVNDVGVDCYGCCKLSDDRMAITNYLEKLIRILNTNATEGNIITTPDYPFDEKQLNDTTLAVSYHRELSGSGSGFGIDLIDIRTKRVVKSILRDHRISGIYARDKNHLIYCERDIGIRMICINNGKVTDIVNEGLPWDCYVASFRDVVIHTNWKTNTVICHNMNGAKKWAFKNENILRKPKGVTIDNSGNVFVAGYDSGKYNLFICQWTEA